MLRVTQKQVFRVSLFGGALIFALWFWNTVHRPSTLPIKTVKVESSYDHLNHSTLIKAIEPFTHQGFFGIDIVSLRENVLKVPWVYQVAVTRVWPDTLNIQVTEQQAIARWGSAGLLNPAGEIFEAALGMGVEKFPLLSGPPGQENQVWQQYQLMNKDLNDIGLSVKECHMSDQGSWWLVTNNGITVVLGRDHIIDRLQRFAEVYPTVIARAELTAKRVDMRYGNGMAVDWTQSA